MSETILQTVGKINRIDEAIQAVENLPINKQYSAQVLVGDRLVEVESIMRSSAPSFIDYIKKKQQLLGIKDEKIDKDFSSLAKLAKRIGAKANRDQRKEALNTLRRRWGEPLAKRIGSDPSSTKSMIKTMNEAWNTYKDRSIALRKLNSIMVNRLLHGKRTSRLKDKIRKMTSGDWKKVLKNQVSEDEEIPDWKLVLIKMHVDDLGILVEGPPNPMEQVKDRRPIASTVIINEGM